ncbi:MAG TPA: DUF5127 domain-containing protein [Planctomycetaceae bacterium]|nr:DUF5127 domain-containing protein [Planctomycetaceae bacterium]
MMITSRMFLNTFLASLFAYLVITVAQTSVATAEDSIRPPAVPFVACDPYFSVWSQSDNLWETSTTHWTGKQHRLAAIVRVDGQAYRLMGSSPQTLAAMKQVSVKVLPTRTIYQFRGADVDVKLTFTTPALPDDVMILSRPTTYVNCEVTSASERIHKVEFYFDAGGELATNVLNQQVAGSIETMANATALKVGTVSQEVLGKAGDDLRIDWGYLYVAVASEFKPTATFGNADALHKAFGEHGSQALTQPSVNFPVEAGSVVAAVAMPVGEVGRQPVSRYALIAKAPGARNTISSGIGCSG